MKKKLTEPELAQWAQLAMDEGTFRYMRSRTPVRDIHHRRYWAYYPSLRVRKYDKQDIEHHARLLEVGIAEEVREGIYYAISYGGEKLVKQLEKAKKYFRGEKLPAVELILTHGKCYIPYKEPLHIYEPPLHLSLIEKKLPETRTLLEKAVKITPAPPSKYPPVTPEEIEEMVRLYEKGLAVKEIAEEVGREVSTVYKKLRERGIRVRAEGLKPAQKGISSPQVRRLGVPRTNVERVMAHYGVSREAAETMIREVGVEKLLPPRGVRVRIPEGYEELSPSSPELPMEEEVRKELQAMVKGEWAEHYDYVVKELAGKGYPEETVRAVLEEQIADPSRWVLEMYPLDVLAWRRSLIELAGKPLTTSEYRLVHSFDDYLSRKGYLTSRQIEVLGEIAYKHDVELPALPERAT